MNLYLVGEGEVTLLMTPSRLVAAIPDVNGVDAVLAYADTEQDVLELAWQYDRGLIQTDNVRLPDGRVVGSLKRSGTGQ